MKVGGMERNVVEQLAVDSVSLKVFDLVEGMAGT